MMKVTPTLPSNLEEYNGTLNGTIKGIISLLKTIRDEGDEDNPISTLPPTIFPLDFFTSSLDVADYTPEKNSISVAVRMSDPIGLVGHPSDWQSQIASLVEKEGRRGYALVFVSSVNTEDDLKVCISVSVDGICKSLMIDTDLESNQKEFDIKDVHDSLKQAGH